MSESVSRGVPQKEYLIPFGEAEVKREGRDVTVVATLLMLHHTLDAAVELAKEQDIEMEVVDPRTLVPLDRDTILDSVKRTGRLVIVEEDTQSYGWGAEVAATVAEHAMGYLDAPIVRLGTPDVPMPAAPELEALLVPNKAKIKETVLRVLGN